MAGMRPPVVAPAAPPGAAGRFQRLGPFVDDAVAVGSEVCGGAGADETQPLMEALRRPAFRRGERPHAPAATGRRARTEVAVQQLADATAPQTGIDHMHVHVCEVGLGLTHEAQQESGGPAVDILQPYPPRPQLIEEQPVHHQTHGGPNQPSTTSRARA